MRLIRRFEEIAEELHEAGEIVGPLHLSFGQEAVAVGVCEGLSETDVIVSTHRGHHHCLAKGARPDCMFAELLGRQFGYARGRGGSMHIYAPEIGILGTNGIVGGDLPIAVGAAYALQVRGDRDVAVCFFGEGAAATGAFGEALNLASLWRLPLVFVCENNQYVALTSQRYHVAGAVWRRADEYDVPGVKVDGNDVTLVADATGEAIAAARAGQGPTLIEALTYRLAGHYVGDQTPYRDEDEVSEWSTHRDPLLIARSTIAHVSGATDERIEAELLDALAAARASPHADEETLLLDHDLA